MAVEESPALTEGYYSVGASPYSGPSPHIGAATWIKNHREQLVQVQRNQPPEELTRDYFIRTMPRLNLSRRISHLSKFPVASNGGFADIYTGVVGEKKVAIKRMRNSSTSKHERMEKVCLALFSRTILY
jgi:hypothetical protein